MDLSLCLRLLLVTIVDVNRLHGYADERRKIISIFLSNGSLESSSFTG
jgi:hypothetical protein